MEQEHKREIENILGNIKCQKDFKCYKGNFENLCKVKDIGMNSYLVCDEEKPRECIFSFSFGYSYFCKCPLRVYIKKNIE